MFTILVLLCITLEGLQVFHLKYSFEIRAIGIKRALTSEGREKIIDLQKSYKVPSNLTGVLGIVYIIFLVCLIFSSDPYHRFVGMFIFILGIIKGMIKFKSQETFFRWSVIDFFISVGLLATLL